MVNRRNNTRRSDVVLGLFLGALAVALAAYAVPALVPPATGTNAEVATSAGASVHAKNRATPDWILELQTRNARQLPVTVPNEEPSFWI